jgi:RHH-type transcriptional regulator, proline utilization regulon repressor / proline dehydrogenase / delta 1-pyrroline-5-carboxylate dehydrogenase
MIRPDGIAIDESRQALREAWRRDEAHCLTALLAEADVGSAERQHITSLAEALIRQVRQQGQRAGSIDALLQEYDLSSQEGVMLMCLAEALIRVPDNDTADRLIQDKLMRGDWAAHLGHSHSLFVNASTWGLMLTGRLISLEGGGDAGADAGKRLQRTLATLVQRSGEPVVRQAIRQAMRIIGRQFVMGRTIDEALRRAADDEAAGYRHSFDMLGEAARTLTDAETYFERYLGAIRAIAARGPYADVRSAPGISVKLSALHPRYEFSQRDSVVPLISERLATLCQAAAAAGIGLCMDAEESDRLELSLDILETVSADSALQDWPGLGLAVQAYQKRAPALIDWLTDLAQRHSRQLMIRLVKGAYWDTEIKLSQEGGFDDYPVYTRKANTDVAYLACAQRLLHASDHLYPQFATHNAQTLAYVMTIAGERPFECQRLHGMGEALYNSVRQQQPTLPCRIYAPVGSHESLLPYLVRRLLENGANSSFVNRIHNEQLPVAVMAEDPVLQARQQSGARHPRIPLPADIYGPARRNARGIDLNDPLVLNRLQAAMGDWQVHQWLAAPLIGGASPAPEQIRQRGVRRAEPGNHERPVGQVCWTEEADIERALGQANAAAETWNQTDVQVRADCLLKMADLLEACTPELLALCVREAGKTFPDAVAEVREAVDFCRYYAQRARQDFAGPEPLPGPTGERNEIRLTGRGVFVCISPWNFPLAIFCGQISAALAAGNAVIAKPAEQTPLIAMRAVSLLHEAGIPAEVLHLLPGDGGVGARLVADSRIHGVAFTGSVAAAKHIQRALATKDGPIVPLIAETGGQNAMIADSTALPEQLVRDVIRSAFHSAGQRCSALRVLYLQDDIADEVLTMLEGAMAVLNVGDPRWLATDIGPVIDTQAWAALQAHIDQMRGAARQCLAEAQLPRDTASGSFIAPVAFEIDSIAELEQEVFGPVLHIIRYRADQLDDVIDDINATGYGLTLGIHSRIERTANDIARRVRVGNCYINRNQVGAVVGVQPFGGEGLSGTGPKAGGPRYLHRFATERVVTVDTTAAGGNASLFALGESYDEDPNSRVTSTSGDS